MKNFCKTAIAIIMLAAITLLGTATSFAADYSLKKGDTLTYTLYLSDCNKPVADMVGYIFYDSSALEPDADSLEFPSVVSVTRNTDLDGYIPFNFSVIGKPVDFSKKNPLLTLSFKAKTATSAKPSYFIGEMDYMTEGENGTIKEFTFTCDYAVNGKLVEENAVPILPKDNLDEYQGSFINYSDGKGEQSKEDHQAVTGEIQKDIPNKEGSQSSMTTLMIVFVIVIILVIAIISVLRRHFSGDAETDEEIEEENGEE